MAKYIDAEPLLKEKYEGFGRVDITDWQKGYWEGIDEICEKIKAQPSSDVVEVVRCKDCIHFTKKEANMFGIDYCHILYYIDGSHREVCKYDYCSYGKKVE